MPLMIIHEEYVDIHILYGFCNGNGRATVAEYQQYFPSSRVPQENAECEQQWHDKENNVLGAVQ
jgi:hypothetical protein